MGKLRNKKVVLAVLILVVLVATLCALVGTSFAGSWTIGTLYYIGSINECKYDIIASANLAVDHVYSALGFKVQLVGISCKRNAFTTFTYDLHFDLYKDGVYTGKSVHPNFKITEAAQVGQFIYNPIIMESSYLSGNGNYELKWYGEIKSNVTQPVNGSYKFSIGY